MCAERASASSSGSGSGGGGSKHETKAMGGGGCKTTARMHVQMLAHVVVLLGVVSVCYRVALVGQMRARWRRERALAMALRVVPRAVLRLNTRRPVDCPRVLVLRTPKTASSTLAALFFMRRVAAGRDCAARFFAAGRYMPKGQYTLTAELLQHANANASRARALLQAHTAFVAHINYTPAIRDAIDVERLYRVATLREPLARAESLFAYEADRPHVRLRPALEYLGAPRLTNPHLNLNDELPSTASHRAIARYAAEVVSHWHLLLLAERWHTGLAVLMHDLRWRLVDVLGPPLNVHQPNARARALKAACHERLANASAIAHFNWVRRVDDKLYALAEQRLRARFSALPPAYRRVPHALRALAPALHLACPTLAEQKHLAPADMRCIRAFRRQLLRAVGAPAAAR